MFALTDLEICTMGLCATIVLCTIGLANSIYRDLRGPPSTSVMRFGVPPTFTRSDPIVGLLIVWPDCKPRLKHRSESWQQRNCPSRNPASRHDLALVASENAIGAGEHSPMAPLGPSHGCRPSQSREAWVANNRLGNMTTGWSGFTSRS